MSLDNALLIVFSVLAVVNLLALGISLKLTCGVFCDVNPEDKWLTAVVLLLAAFVLDVFAALTMFSLLW